MARPKKRKSSPSPEELGDTKAFWDQQAKLHRGSEATVPDQHYRALEIESIIRALTPMNPATILDVGCGNGYATKIIANQFPDADITGVDFSEAMIDEAHIQHNGTNIDYLVGDVLSLSRCPGLRGRKYDVVLSSRVLINLANWEEQKVGILEMRKMLNPDGHLILVENFQDGLDNLNSVRTSVGLPPIKVRWHNNYLPQKDFMKFLTEIQGHLLTTEYVENIGNMYYIASRVIYAKLCQEQGVEPDYNHSINKTASMLPTMGEFYACSPNFMVILKNASETWTDRKLSS